jgi:hypothetical protein
VKLKRDGIVVVGGAVGSDDFARRHFMGVPENWLRMQNALLLLSGCLSTALTYHLQVTYRVKITATFSSTFINFTN